MYCALCQKLHNLKLTTSICHIILYSVINVKVKKSTSSSYISNQKIMSKERIIPIEILTSDDSENTNDSQVQQNSEQSPQIKELSIKIVKAPFEKVIKSKEDEILKEFDMFDNRNGLTLPNANVPEKIILVIDRAQDESYTPFIVNNNKYKPFTFVKKAANTFIKLKLGINSKHEFAIVTLNENVAQWVIGFTNDQKKLTNALSKIASCEVEDTFPLNSLFEEILNNVNIPQIIHDKLPPPFVTRAIIFYGRSYTIPTLTIDNAIRDLLEHRDFICDILMTHESVDRSNHCNTIFDILQNLDKKGYAYFLPVCRDITRLNVSVAKLLGHPLQRPVQKLQKI